ncbi:MAG: C25 family cysteine peptidase [Candidatus Thermoplasmatota archaeon]
MFWKEKRMRKAAIPLFFAVMMIVSTGAVPSTAGGAGEIKQTFTAGAYEINEENGVHQIQMLSAGYHLMESPGDPALPERVFEIQVPDTIDWSTVQLTVEHLETVTLEGSYVIAPNPPFIIGETESESSLEWGYGKSIVEGKNTFVYECDERYPAESVVLSSYTERQQPADCGCINAKYALVAYRPFLYNPVSQELTLVEEATIRLTYESPAGITMRGPLRDSYDFVIITTNDIVSHSETLDNFIALKEFAGHDVLVVTETEYGGLAGAETADKIRNWLIANDGPLGIEYVLLIGDPNPDDLSDDWVNIPSDPLDSVGDLPMKMSWVGYADWNAWQDWAYHGYPTDMFYADLTGDWDLDNDGLFGEDIDFTNPASPYPGEAAFDDGTYSVIWEGQLEIPSGTTYRFHTFSDDGVRLEIDGTTVFSNFGPHDWPINEFSNDAGNSGDLLLFAGMYNITLEYDNHGGDGIIRLWWHTPFLAEGDPDFVNEIIPETRLYDVTGGSSGGLDGTYYTDSAFTTVGHTRKDPTINFIWATGDDGPGGVDYGAENYVGRIPVYDDDYDQLDSILNKIITYETDQGNISWRESFLVAVAPLSDSTPAYQYGEAVKTDITDPAGFDSYRIYWDDYSATGGPTPDDWPTSEVKVKAEWADGYGLVTWWTHGSPQSASHVFSTASILDLDDSTPAFVYQATCLNGYPEDSDNLGYALLKHGAVATICATRVSTGSRGNWVYDPTSSANPNWGYAYIQHLITDGYTAGQALYDAKDDVTSISRNLMNYNLYGDPTITYFDIIENSPPTADIGGPYHVDEGSSVTLDASGSFDVDGDALTYAWDLDGDGAYDDAVGVTASYHGVDDAVVTLGLLVSDGIFEDTDATSLTVHNVDPEVSAVCGSTLNENEQATCDITIHDEGVEDTFRVEVDWGDGSALSILYPGDAGDVVIHPTHTYLDDTPSSTPSDIYTISVSVIDDDGGDDSDSDTVTVNNVAPVATAVGASIDENDTATMSGTIMDPGTQDTFSVVIDWGEGAPQTYLYPAGATSYSETHQYLDDNPTGTPTDEYAISVTVTDDDTGEATATATVSVDNVDPTITVFKLDQPNPQFILPLVHALTFTGEFTDQGTQDTHTILWDFDDGQTASTLNTTHTYTAPGLYEVSLTVEDDDTGVDEDSLEVNVTDEFGALADLDAYIQGLPASAFKGSAKLRKQALKNMISAVHDMLVDMEYQGAITSLVNNIRAKADGFIDGKSSDDWIIDFEAQYHICMKIDDLTGYLGYLLHPPL